MADIGKDVIQKIVIETSVDRSEKELQNLKNELDKLISETNTKGRAAIIDNIKNIQEINKKLLEEKDIRERISNTLYKNADTISKLIYNRKVLNTLLITSLNNSKQQLDIAKQILETDQRIRALKSDKPYDKAEASSSYKDMENDARKLIETERLWASHKQNNIQSISDKQAQMDMAWNKRNEEINAIQEKRDLDKQIRLQQISQQTETLKQKELLDSEKILQSEIDQYNIQNEKLNIASQLDARISEEAANKERINNIEEKHIALRKKISNTLHNNANTIERMEHNVKALNTRLQKTVVGSKEHKDVLAKINTLENQITNAKKQQNNIIVQAVKHAFSWEKIMNRMAFVITAKLSYELFNTVVRGIKSAIANTVEWQNELSKVYTLLDASEKKYKEYLSSNVAEAVSKYGQDLATASRAVYDIISARFEPSEVGTILTESLKLAVGEFTDLRVATDAVTTVLNSFNLSATQAGKAASFLAQMVTDGKTTLEELHNNLGKITSTAAMLGFKMEEIGAAFSTITLQGIKTDVAITSLRQLMLKLYDPTEEAKQIMVDYGLELDIASIKAGGFTKVLEEMKGLTEEQLLAFAKSRSGAQALFALINSGERFQESYNNQLNNTNVHLEKYEERMNNVELAKRNLSGTFKVVTAQINNDLLPAYNSIIKALTGIVKGMRLAVPAITTFLFTLALLRTGISLTTTKAITASYSFAVMHGAMKLGTAGAAIEVAALTALIATTVTMTKINDEYNESLLKTNELRISDIQGINEYKKNLENLSKKELEDEKERLDELIKKIEGDKITYELKTVVNESQSDKTNRKEKIDSLEKELQIYNDMLKSVEDRMNYIKTDRYIRNQNIKNSLQELDLAKERLQYSERELEDLEEVRNALIKVIEIKKENIDSDKLSESIRENKLELGKIDNDIANKRLELAKKKLDIAGLDYELGEDTNDNFAALVKAHEEYIGLLTDIREKKQAQLVLDKLIYDNKVKTINKSYELKELQAKSTKSKIDDLKLQLKKEKELAELNEKSEDYIKLLTKYYEDQIEIQKLEEQKELQSDANKIIQLGIDLRQKQLDYNISINKLTKEQIENEQKEIDIAQNALDYSMAIAEIDNQIKSAEIEGDEKKIALLKEQKDLLTEISKLTIDTSKISLGQLKYSDINWYNILGIPEFESGLEVITYLENKLANTIMSGIDVVLQHQLNAIEKRKEANLEALSDEYNAYKEHVSGLLLTESHRSRVMESISNAEKKKQEEIEKEAAEKLAEQKKRNAIYEATIDYARGLIGIWANALGKNPSPVGLKVAAVMSAILSGLYAAQRSIIDNTKYAGGGFTGNSSQSRDETGERPAGIVHEKEFVFNKKATTGNVKQLYALQDTLAKGKTFEEFASEYIIGKINPSINVSPKLLYAAGGYVSNKQSSNTNVDFRYLESSIESQQETFNKIEKRLANIEKYNRDVVTNTDKMRRKKAL